MIDARPSFDFVKGEVTQNARTTLFKATEYTDAEIQKLKNAEGAIAKSFEAFKTETSVNL